MGIQDRPYIGTWRLKGKDLVQHTPDAMVFVNGDLSLPGCPKCHSRINLQKYLTEVSVDAGTEPNSASATFTLAAPLHSLDPFIRDANFILRPGLEVHVYMRGYFPVSGLFTALGEDQSKVKIEQQSTGPVTPAVTAPSTPPAPAPGIYTVDNLLPDKTVQPPSESDRANLEALTKDMDTIHQYMGAYAQTAEGQEAFPGFAGDLQLQVSPHGGYSKGSTYEGHVAGSQHDQGNAVDFTVTYRGTDGKRHTVDNTVTRGALYRLRDSGYIEKGGIGTYVTPGTTDWYAPPHYDRRGTNSGWTHQPGGADTPTPSSFNKVAGGMPAPGSLPGVQAYNQHYATPPTSLVNAAPNGDRAFQLSPEDLGPSMLDQAGLGGMNIESILSYPYYHVFHGVVIQAGHQYSGGVNNITVSCASMLHFWQYQNMSTNASYFGARPTGSKLKMALETGHNFTGMHPYEIIYTLHHDTAGAAGGVSWALSQKTNQGAVSEVGGESLFSLNLRYWEKRFGAAMIKLRLHGASGELFSALQAAYIARTPGGQLMSMLRARFLTADKSKKELAQKWLNQMAMVGWGRGLRTARSIYDDTGADVSAQVSQDADGNLGSALVVAPTSKEAATDNPDLSLNLIEMQAFVSNITNWGQVNLFESTYESKLDIANKVCQVTGFEFYQDVDGDFVFKPPMYNLDTSTSRVYTIEDIDIISLNFDEKEPQFTYIRGKGSVFKNMAGFGLENEWGVEGMYIDYRLVAQFGWRPADFETAYFNDPRSIFFAAVNRLDVLNAVSNSASLTIPIRPEMRPGYPVYIKYIDAYYYCTSFAHQFSVGGQCTTALQLIGKRSKFFAPGDPKKRGVEAIDLKDTLLPERGLEVLDDAGHPRLVGFPNVVMALDPTQLNPLFFVVGGDMDEIDDGDWLNNILTLAEKSLPAGVLTKEGNVYTLTYGGTDNKKITFWYQPPDSPEATPPAGMVRIIDGVAKYASARTDLKARQAKVAAENRAWAKKQAAAVTEWTKLNDQIKKGDPGGKIAAQLNDLAAKQVEYRRKIKEGDDQIAAMAETFAQDLTKDQGSAVAFLMTVIKEVGDAYRTTHPQMGDLTSTRNILDMLSDKKAIFNTGISLPGTYRYYSVSHPDSEMQGQATIHIKDKTVETGKPDLDPPWAGKQTLGFLSKVKITTPSPNMPPPEAQLGKIPMLAGIRVLTGRKAGGHGEVVPTSEIRELSFATHKVTGSKWRSGAGGGDAAAMMQPPVTQFKDAARQGSNATDIKAAFAATWNGLVVRATPAGAAVPKDKKAPPMPPFPATLTINGQKVGTSSGMGAAVTAAKAKDTTALLSAAAKALAAEYHRTVQLPLQKWVKDNTPKPAKGKKPSPDDLAAKKALALAQAGAAKAVSAKVAARPKKTTANASSTGTIVVTPVLPVSDKEGYRVIGSYRYGRDLNIDADGVWGRLTADPLSILDKDTLDRVLAKYVRREPLTVDQPGKDGKTHTTVPANANVAQPQNTLEDKLLSQLRTVMTERQIIDAGLAIKVGNQLQLNLQNWLKDGHEGVQKMPINNVAYSLADLTAQDTGAICDCKAAEASILLEAFSQQAFVQVNQVGAPTTQGLGQGPMSQTTKWLRETTTLASVDWRQSQAALRGEVLDRGGVTGLIQTFKDSIAQLKTVGDQELKDTVAAYKAMKAKSEEF